MKILVLNCGSSSVKFRLFEMTNEDLLAVGQVDRIGFDDACLTYQFSKNQKHKEITSVKDHGKALDLLLRKLCHPEIGIIQNIMEIDAIGHRVVHGGEAFTESVYINETIFHKIQECSRFAPLHNPPNLKGIQASLWFIPFARQVAVFDTAFHHSMDSHTYLYALPYEWYTKHGIRRYGFHGTSHRYVAHKAALLLGKSIKNLKMITCHLGNGSSITAVDRGRSVDTSMGFTPLEGMIMGTRCGDIDPAIPLYIMEEDHLTTNQMDEILNKKSGLLGITSGDSDMRTIEEKAAAGSEQHQLAVSMLTQRIKKYIGAYAAVMGGLDALVFTAGIGEKSSTVRRMSCKGLEFLGIKIDEEKNAKHEIQIGCGETSVMVIPTNEELAIAQEVKTLLEKEDAKVVAKKEYA